MKKAVLLLCLLFPSVALAQTTEPEIQLGPGDVIEIRFFYNPEMNVVQTIRPDGKIFLQLIGEVVAKGSTPIKLQEKLFKQFSQYFKQLDIAIIIQSFAPYYVYVGGQVNEPGTIPIQRQRPLTALEAIMLAGGINTENATYQNIMILHYENGKWIHTQLNLEDVLFGEENAPTYLQPFDIIYVPQHTLYK
jgi:polysaccharide export outer membrane protein